MEFREFRKKITKLRPKEKGFRERALPHFKRVLEEIGLKDEEQAIKIANQIINHYKANVLEGKSTYGGDLLKDAFIKALAPTSLSPQDLHDLAEALKSEELSWKISILAENSRRGIMPTSKEIHELRLEIKDRLPCIDDIVAHSAVSRAVVAHATEGKDEELGKILQHYTAVREPSEEFKKRLRGWLEEEKR